MMDLNVNIDPEQINKLVAEAVLNSAIGEQVKAQVQKNVDELGKSYNNPIDAVIKKHINDLILQCLMAEHAELLKAKVHEALSGKITDEFVNKVMDAGWRNI
ncbi:MAG: hypothetical protein RPU73_12740 [Candidatus Sedimenticola sp. (ex Thyasira tokunagai)]